MHLQDIFPTCSGRTIISCFGSGSWCKNGNVERFVGCGEGTEWKAQMEAIPRERGHGGSVMLPVHPPSLGCMGSAGGIGKDFGV